MQDDDEYTRVGRRYVEGAYDGVCKSMGMMTTKEARDIILNDPDGNIIKRMEAIAVARYFLGENCTMEEIWRWAEGNVKEVTVRVKTCFECTAYVDIDGEQSRCGLGRDPLKCDRKMAL